MQPMSGGDVTGEDSDFAFQTLDLHRIYAGTDTRNERCWRLLERVGMRREAHFRHEYCIGGEWIDSYVYATLEGERRGG